MKTNLIILLAIALFASLAYHWAGFRSILKWNNEGIDIY